MGIGYNLLGAVKNIHSSMLIPVVFIIFNKFGYEFAICVESQSIGGNWEVVGLGTDWWVIMEEWMDVFFFVTNSKNTNTNKNKNSG